MCTHHPSIHTYAYANVHTYRHTYTNARRLGTCVRIRNLCTTDERHPSMHACMHASAAHTTRPSAPSVHPSIQPSMRTCTHTIHMSAMHVRTCITHEPINAHPSKHAHTHMHACIRWSQWAVFVGLLQRCAWNSLHHITHATKHAAIRWSAEDRSCLIPLRRQIDRSIDDAWARSKLGAMKNAWARSKLGAMKNAWADAKQGMNTLEQMRSSGWMPKSRSSWGTNECPIRSSWGWPICQCKSSWGWSICQCRSSCGRSIC
jgi:hypothetical protein